MAFQPGEIKAVASSDGHVVATQVKRTAGDPVALRVTPIVGPGGLRADGSDVALFDVEAVDARGERCPTVQQRVNYAVEGPATWRGGYNSGRTGSTNHLFLDLEAGISRVSVRAGRVPGRLTVRATSSGLKAGAATVESAPFTAADGSTTTMPAVAEVRRPPPQT